MTLTLDTVTSWSNFGNVKTTGLSHSRQHNFISFVDINTQVSTAQHRIINVQNFMWCSFGKFSKFSWGGGLFISAVLFYLISYWYIKSISLYHAVLLCQLVAGTVLILCKKSRLSNLPQKCFLGRTQPQSSLSSFLRAATVKTIELHSRRAGHTRLK